MTRDRRRLRVGSRLACPARLHFRNIMHILSLRFFGGRRGAGLLDERIRGVLTLGYGDFIGVFYAYMTLDGVCSQQWMYFWGLGLE